MKKIFAFIAIILTMLCISNVKATYTPDKEHSAIKKGDVIYFDATGLDWNHIYIHIWEKNGATYKAWDSNDELVKVPGEDNIYMFTAPDSFDEYHYNMIIFHNENGGDSNKTINLGYIEKNYAYKITGYSGSKRIGNWYLYDKTELQTRLSTLKEYQNNKEYYTSTSFSNLDELIENIETAISSEITLNEDTTTPGKFYIQVDYTFGEADDIVDALEVNTALLSNLITEEEGKYEDYANNYTKDSIDSLKEVIEAQKTVLEGTTITIDDIKNGIDSINTAKNNLKNQADKTELLKQLEEINALEKDKYTDESFKNVEDLLDEANELKNNTNATQENVDEMVTKLKAARASLKEKTIEEAKEETLEEVKEEKKEAEAPKTLDDIVKIFAILGGCVVVLVAIAIIMKKMKKKLEDK